ncbi:MAG: hypothetical protein US49_C0001G0230 [candidate division TM6 bacterium GW2011_GWF2_37_49]|nr:MAG: hypothetical protein US49_C0001G0230 [candidate division TM6 bacterium GW2011_GWF2_37_49]
MNYKTSLGGGLMNILKQIQLLVLIFAPIYLFGMDQISWIEQTKSCQSYGVWAAKDCNNKLVLVEGEIISNNGMIIASAYDLIIVATLFTDTMEAMFGKIYDKSEPCFHYAKYMIQSAQKIHHNGLYDAYIQKIKTAMQQDQGDLYYIVTVSEIRENGKNLLGAAIFDIQKNFEYGTVELELIAVKLEAQSMGLGTILTSAILKLLPQVKRIIIGVHQDNFKAIGVFEHIGFRRTASLDSAYHYEYLTEWPASQRLQAYAATFIELKI